MKESQAFSRILQTNMVIVGLRRLTLCFFVDYTVQVPGSQTFTVADCGNFFFLWSMAYGGFLKYVGYLISGVSCKRSKKKATGPRSPSAEASTRSMQQASGNMSTLATVRLCVFVKC